MTPSPSSTSAATLPGLLLERARVTPNGEALRHHTLGIWKSTTWTELASKVRTVGNALTRLGVASGDTVALISRNSPEWMIADLAIQGLGASSLVLHPDFSPGTVATLLNGTSAKLAIVGDEEQYDKIVGDNGQAWAARLVQTLIVVNSRGIKALGHGSDGEQGDERPDGGQAILEWSALMQLGDGTDTWTPSAEALSPEGETTIVTPVGPDGVTLRPMTSTEVLAMTESLGARLDAHGGDELLPTDSFADMTERAITEVLTLTEGATLNIGEGGSLEGLERQAVQPTLVHIPAQQLRDIHDDIVARLPRRGIRRYAVNKLASSTGVTTSRSSRRDLIISRVSLVALAILALVVHQVCSAWSGWARLGTIAVFGLILGAALLFTGLGIRPFIRRHYGLANARSLLTTADIDDATTDFFGALHLRPLLLTDGADNT